MAAGASHGLRLFAYFRHALRSCKAYVNPDSLPMGIFMACQFVEELYM